MDYTVENLQVEVNAPSEDAVVAYAQAFTKLVEEEEEVDA